MKRSFKTLKQEIFDILASHYIKRGDTINISAEYVCSKLSERPMRVFTAIKEMCSEGVLIPRSGGYAMSGQAFIELLVASGDPHNELQIHEDDDWIYGCGAVEWEHDGIINNEDDLNYVDRSKGEFE